MKGPANCFLWNNPEAARDWMLNDGFERLETYFDYSNHWRYLLRCRECGQLYFYEFYEFMDLEGGEDPQYQTYIPVETAAEIESLTKTDRLDLMCVWPRLNSDFPKGAKEPSLYWVRLA